MKNPVTWLISYLREAKEELQKVVGACDASASSNPEWYLRIRDYLLRLR